MKTHRNRPDDGRTPRLSDSPIEDESVRRQLGQLFGEGLFGPWPQLHQNSGDSRPQRRSMRWLWKLSVTVALAAAAFALHSLVRPGLRHQLDDQRGRYAQELKAFINDGNLENAAQFVPL